MHQDSFALRAGLTNAALEAVTGVTGAIFCHNARFIATAATREAALRVADFAVTVAEDQVGLDAHFQGRLTMNDD